MKRERRAAIFWAVLVLGVVAWLGVRRLRPPLLHGGWKALWVDVDGVEPTDAAVNRLNDRLEKATRRNDLRNSEPLGFTFWDGRVRASAKVLGDDWDLSIYLRALQQLSTEEPQLTFHVESEPEGEKFSLHAGSAGAHSHALQAFLDEHAAARPNFEGRFTSITVEGPGDPAAVRASVERQLGEQSTEHVTRPIEYAAASSGVKLSATTDGDVRTAARLIAVFQLALTQGANSLNQPAYVVTLDGKEHREEHMLGFEDWFRLRGELEQAVGPAEPFDPKKRAENSGNADGGAGGAERAAAPNLQPRVLAHHPEVAPLMGGRALIWRGTDGAPTRLGPDGTLEVIAEIPELRSPDGKWLYFSEPRADTARLAPANGGAASPLPTLDRGQIRRVIGFAGARLAAVEITELRLGRISERVALYAANEEPKRSEIFYNLQGPLVTGDAALFTAELDGREKLVRLDLSSLKSTADERWPAALRARKLEPTGGGRALIVLEDATPQHPRIELRRLDGDGTVRAIEASGGARLDGWFLNVLGAERGVAWLEVQGTDHALALWRVDVDGEKLERPALPGGRPFQIAVGGKRVAVVDEKTVTVAESGATWTFGEAPVRPFAIAMSDDGGALAALTWSPKPATLELATDEQHQLTVELPQGGRLPRWLAPGEAPAWRK